MPFKYQQLSPAGKRLARIPRFGRLIGMMSPAQFSRLTSEAATFWELYSYVDFHSAATTGLIDSGLNTDGARLLGWLKVESPQPEPDRSLLPIREWQRDLAMGLLGAIAFEMTCGANGTGQTAPVYFVEGNLRVFMERVINRFWESGAYIDECGDRIPSKRNLWNEWKRLKEMNSQGLQYFLLSDCGPTNSGTSQPSERILFADRSTQEFFAAYWACRWASAAEIQLIQGWLPDPHLSTKSQYAEFWQMVVDMPDVVAMRDIARPTDRYEKLLSPLYNGEWRDQNGDKIRSTELIYKSWKRMKNTGAGLVFRKEFDEILSGNDKRAEVAQGFLEYQNPTTKKQESQFLSLSRNERGRRDTGVFLMGAPADEYPAWDCEAGSQNNPQHRVCLSHYRLHRLCVTNVAYELFDPRHQMLRAFSGKVKNVDDHPVVNVNWYDAICFARWLDKIELDGERYLITLPSEAEWEYACRCGEQTPFTWDTGRDGRRIESGDCNFDGNYPWSLPGAPTPPKGKYRGRTVRVDGMDEDGTQITPNAWGFYQLHGNAWEWCWDRYEEDYYRLEIDSEASDPLGPDMAIWRILRGGGWSGSGRSCRSAVRNRDAPEIQVTIYGFRLAATPAERGER